MKFLKRLFLLILVAGIVFFGYQIRLGYEKYEDALINLPLDEAVANLRGKEHYTVYGDIPEIYFQAVVAVEDRRFYKHKGFDFIGALRAIYSDIRAKEMLEGGSTISQQLAKNMYFPKDYTLRRKIAEIFMARKIEREYEKEDILEFYANIIYFGSGYYCIYDASEGYFGKKPADMTNDECTLLAGVPNAPSVYSPKVNPELARNRQEKVIKSMIECRYITSEQKITNKTY